MVSSVNNNTTTSAATTASSNSMIAGNFQQFLTLLTTQLQNQNPLDPMDTNQFTQQLVQFASVEQQLKTNDTLAALLTSSKASSATSALQFIGKTVTADGATTKLQNGSATWAITMPRAAKQATVTIRDADGNTIYTQTGAMDAGTQTLSWDGRKTSGGTAPDGAYTITVTAVDVNGNSMTPSTDFSGVVESVDLSGSEPALVVGGISVPLSQVRGLKNTAS